MFDQYEGDLVELFAGESDDELYELTLAEWDREERVEVRQWIPADLDSMVPGRFWL